MIDDLIIQLNRLQRRVDRLARPEVGRWQDWTATVTQNVAVTFSAANSFARYKATDSGVEIRARLAITSSGTAGNAITVGGLPISIGNASGIIGTVRVIDSGVASYVGGLQVASATTLVGVSDGNALAIGVTPNFGLVSGDTIDLVGHYERA